MSDAVASLQAVLPPGRFTALGGDMPGDRDLGRFDIGRPLAVVRPESTDEVQAIVRCARGARVRVAPVGCRSAYWWPLDLGGAIAIDTSGLRGVEVDPAAGCAVSGAGMTLLELEEGLSAAGCTLPLVPDAFGDTSIGSFVATGCAAGMGMATTDVDGMVVGLEAVLGSGERVVSGMAATLGARPFLRPGLPDPTGLLVGSQGSLGIVTKVFLRLWRRAWRAHLAFTGGSGLPGLGAVLDLARDLRCERLYESLRAVRLSAPGREEPVALDLVLRTPFSDDELSARIEFARRVLAAHLPGAEPSLEREAPDLPPRIPRFREPRNGHRHMYRQGHFAGLDVMAPADTARDVLALWEEGLAGATGRLGLHVRQDLYLAPDYVNLGLHMIQPNAGADAVPALHELLGDLADRVAGLPIVPYRWGGLWAPRLASKLDPGYRRLMAAIEDLCDPDGILPRRAAASAGLRP